MREQPTSIQLIQSVIDFLHDDVTPGLDGLTAFHARVAISLLKIVQRELETGPRADAAEQDGLETLLGKAGTLDELNQELCARIADGNISLDTSGLLPHLLRTTLDKLAVDQPRYSTYLRLTDAAKPVK